MKQYKQTLGIILALFVLSSCGSNSSSTSKAEESSLGKNEPKIAVSSIKKGDIFEFDDFTLYAINTKCKDPNIYKVTFLDSNKAKVYCLYKGCNNTGIEEDELIYDYKIDNATNWKHEYEWLKTDPDVLILENHNGGYRNGHRHLSKRLLIANTYNGNRFIEFRLFCQLDPEDYPARNGVFTTIGGLKK